MKATSLLRVSAVGLAASMAFQAIAEDRQRVITYPSPVAGEALSGPSLDAPQAALNVSVPSIYVPITPCRLADTRRFLNDQNDVTPTPIGGLWPGAEQVGFWGWAEGADNYLQFGGSGVNCGIPGDATAIHVNFTIVSPKGDGYLRAWPNGTGEPTATLFAWDAGFGVSNAGTIAICSDGTTGNDYETQCVNPDVSQPGTTIDFLVNIYSREAENLVIDAFGYYTAAP